MFETFVSSRIRRTLLEHILCHPNERFYLRGLAKELSLPISPLRRELLRLEQLGVLSAYEEANARFYTVNQSHPQFVQLKQAAMVAAPAGVAMNPVSPTPPAPSILTQPEPIVAATTLSHQKVERIRKALAPRVSLPILVSALSFGLLIVGVFAISVHLAVTPRMAVAPTVPVTPTAQVAAPEAGPPPASGEMRGARWHLVPGGMGGFSSGTTREGSH